MRLRLDAELRILLIFAEIRAKRLNSGQFRPNFLAESPALAIINILWLRTQSNKPFLSYMPEYFQTSPISFCTKAIRCPPAFSRMCRIIVVFPAPGKPAITVADVFEIISPSSTKFASAADHSMNAIAVRVLESLRISGQRLFSKRHLRRAGRRIRFSSSCILLDQKIWDASHHS